MASANIQITDDLFHNANSFPNDSTLEVEVRNGKKEGKAIVYSAVGVSLAELNFQNDKLHGLCLYFNSYGDREKQVMYENGVQEGWFCTFEDNMIYRMGMYKNGKEFSELRKCKENADYFEEVKDNKVLSICKFNEHCKREGLCTFFHNGKVSSVVQFENGIEKEKKYEFINNKMIEFDDNMSVIYRGEYKGDTVSGFTRSGNGMSYQYSNGKVVRVDFVKNGVKNGYQLIGDKLKEYDNKDKLVYEGEFEGSAEDGFEWCGLGIEYKSDSCYVNGEYEHGKRVKTIREIDRDRMIEYDDENRICYIGEFSSNSFERSGRGRCFEYDGMKVRGVNECENGEITRKMCEFDDKGMTEYNANGEVVYKGGFKGDVQKGFVREGEGIEFDKDVALYIGNWVNGVKEGIGRSYRDRKVRYKGSWKNGKPHGNGELMNGYETMYKGEWKNGFFEIENGIGFDFESEKICGLYENGLKKYEGEMKNGLPDGNGKYFDKDGRVLYEGKWKKGCIEISKGNGFDFESERKCSLYENGLRKYVGEMKNGLPDGKGRYFDKDGRVLYEGYWVDGEIHIKGNEWFCYKSGMKELRRIRSVVEKSREVMKELGKWMRTKTGKIVTGVVIVMIIILIFLIVAIVYGWFFKMGSGFEIKDGVLTISGGSTVTGAFSISGYKNVYKIVVKDNALENVRKLTIKSLTDLIHLI